MEAQFWFNKWSAREIGFHQEEVNRFLEQYFSHLDVPEGGRVFIPLCGKTLDAAWLASQGYQVVGAELSETAIQEFFEELGVEPQIDEQGSLKCYRAENLDFWVGDIFELNAQLLGTVDAVYDRAALVALPKEMRDRYTQHLLEITEKAPQLLISFEYDQSVMPGPPFCVDGAEVRDHYGASGSVEMLVSAELEGGLKGICPAQEVAWHIAPE